MTLLLKWVQPLDPCHLNSKVNSKVNKSGGWLGDLLGFPTQNPTSYLQHVCLARLKRYTYLYPKTGINRYKSEVIQRLCISPGCLVVLKQGFALRTHPPVSALPDHHLYACTLTPVDSYAAVSFRPPCH